MKHDIQTMSLATVVAIGLTFSYQPVFAADDDDLMETVITIGTRSAKERSASDSPVPIDVIGGDDFDTIGGSADITDNLRALVPSYTATPATGDGSAFVRPTSLRGMASDQTLILVNGKRRHRSALVQFFAPAAGNGAHGADVGMIPAIALKRVEVLRDGAAAQYGSDAISGVINLVTKDASEGGEFQVQYGQYYEGEESYKFAGNLGLSVGDNGFINLSLEYVDNEALSRGVQRFVNSEALEAAGVTGIGADTPFDDEPLLQTWGRPEYSGVRFFANSSFELTDSANLYVFANYGSTEGRYRFFYRTPDHSSLLPLRAMGFTGLQAGYTPFLDGDQTDFSIVGGFEGEFSGGILYDFSVAYGENELEYFLNNTINQTLGLVNGEPAQRNFDVGAYRQEEINLNADFSIPVSDNVNVGLGAEWREETYVAEAGEINSFIGAGSNGLNGIGTQDAGSFDRDNYAVYADLEHDVTDRLLMQYAIRFEEFSDFGSTVNGKFAVRYHVSEDVAIRGAISNGFHAPTPGQSNVKTTITTFDGTTGLQIEEGLIRPTDPDAVAAGGTALTEEKSFNVSLGVTANLGNNTTFTFDLYHIEVDDKIYRTRDIVSNGNNVSFYTNTLDVQSEGLDLVITTGWDWGSVASTDMSLAYSNNQVTVTGQSAVGGIDPVSDSIIQDIENNYPNHRFVLTANTY
ncbi:MAG: TonB-dependent receptor, partial [bacterium]